MKDKPKYKRFMVFSWSDYDNVDPFGCVNGDYDSKREAKKALDKGSYGRCIFDRLTRDFVIYEEED